MRIINKIRSIIIGKTLEPNLVNITGFSQMLENVEIVQNLDNFISCAYGLYGNKKLKRVVITFPIFTNCENFSNMFNNCSSLTEVPLFDTSSGTDFSGMFSGCSSLTEVPLFDTSSGTNFDYMFSSTYLATIPLIDTSSGTNFTGMFNQSLHLITIPLIDTSSGTDFSYMFEGCISLTSIPLIDTSAGTNFNYMFNSCTTLTVIPLLITSSGTNFGGMFNNCQSLSIIPNLDYSNDAGDVGGYYFYGNFVKILITFGELDITISANLDRQNIVAVFNNLPVTVLSPTIFLYGDPGVADLSPTDIEIATNKGWIVTTAQQG